jgi:hypothetical protein
MSYFHIIHASAIRVFSDNASVVVQLVLGLDDADRNLARYERKHGSFLVSCRYKLKA